MRYLNSFRFDALIFQRPYKEPFPLEKALQMLKEDSGVFFDPALVDVFVRMAGSLHAKIGEADDMVLEKKLNGLIDQYSSADLRETAC